MEVKGKIELEDLKKKSSRVMLRTSIILPLLTILAIALFLNIALSLMEGNGPFSAVFDISLSWHIYLFVLLLAGYVILAAYEPIKTYKKNIVFHNEITYYIDNERLGIATVKGSVYLNWRNIFKIREYDDSFLFFHSFNEAYILPKRFFNSLFLILLSLDKH